MPATSVLGLLFVPAVEDSSLQSDSRLIGRRPRRRWQSSPEPVELEIDRVAVKVARDADSQQGVLRIATGQLGALLEVLGWRRARGGHPPIGLRITVRPDFELVAQSFCAH